MTKSKISIRRAGCLKEKPLRQDYKPGSDVTMLGLKSAVIEALFSEDFDTFRGCIAILLDKCKYQDIAKKTGLSKSTLYRMCEPGSNPTLENIGKVLSFINTLSAKLALKKSKESQDQKPDVWDWITKGTGSVAEPWPSVKEVLQKESVKKDIESVYEAFEKAKADEASRKIMQKLQIK